MEWIVETKIHDLDVKVTEVQTTVEQLQRDVDGVSDDDEALPTTR